MRVNEKQKTTLVDKIISFFGKDLSGIKFALWGLAFKPETDDIREAPSLEIIAELKKLGANITAYDPEAMNNVKDILGNSIEYAKTSLDAIVGADALIIATEWAAFRNPDFDILISSMKSPVIFDGRNLFSIEYMQNKKFYYQSVGRKLVNNLPNEKNFSNWSCWILGSHLCERFLKEEFEVIGMDNFITGSAQNIELLAHNKNFEFIKHDVSNFIKLTGDLDFILHFASPASPIDYLKIPIQTLKVGSLGTHNLLGLAKAKKAVILVASTSEVYGDPLIHPQDESYFGNVNPIGPRGVYDEAKKDFKKLLQWLIIDFIN